MEIRKQITERVHDYYWKDNINCATTTLMILAELFRIDCGSQVLDSAIGMHGAAEYGAQCGLAEGSLMFLGIIGRDRKIPDVKTKMQCREFARRFEKRFGNLLCRILRPQGFHPDNPPHLCEGLTSEAIFFSYTFVSEFVDQFETVSALQKAIRLQHETGIETREFKHTLTQLIRVLREHHLSHDQIAGHFNQIGIPVYTGKRQWHKSGIYCHTKQF